MTLEQSLQPVMLPPKPMDRAIKSISAKQVHILLLDLRKEVGLLRTPPEIQTCDQRPARSHTRIHSVSSKFV